MITILGLRVGISKNENIDHQGKENCANESDISLCCDSVLSSALNFYLLSTLLQPKRKKSY